jgi:ABC-type glutathione transport system ATPase component
LCLVVSGGHSHLVEVKDYTDFKVIGYTHDDAAGEAMDKAARAMGLPYPGGLNLDRVAKDGDNKAYKMPHQLSGGEQQRVVIARALLNSPGLILADEPTGNLDPETGKGIMELLYSISKAGMTVIMSTHNHQWPEIFPGRKLLFEGGKITEE